MKVAVLSFAHEHAGTYARLLHGMPDVDLVIADPGGSPRDPRRGREAAGRLGAVYTDSWDEVFALRPDAVVVTSETGLHRELIERAAAAGAHVLCEHPVAAGEADADAAVRACAEAGVRLALASPACFGPAFAALRRQLAEGDALGSLTTVLGAYNKPWNAARSGAAARGVLDSTAPQLLDMVDAVLGGAPAEQVYAQANSILASASGGAEPGVESAALVTVRYADGTVVSLDCGAGPARQEPAAGGPALTLIGDRGSIEFTATPRLVGGFDAATSRERWETRGKDPDAVMLAGFLAAIGEGARRADADPDNGPGPDGAAGLRTLRIVQAARASLRTGRPVTLTAPPPQSGPQAEPRPARA
ncbi:Gfo/Idh/MocA family oxidoreductase [Streptomyces sp. NPDC006552]|uniref:Gfo/Idh/MocA family protein n=1 Tax=Streptomyces sp. NPDC006552 TaxID=3157179 RepID=UPI0033B038B7